MCAKRGWWAIVSRSHPPMSPRNAPHQVEGNYYYYRNQRLHDYMLAEFGPEQGADKERLCRPNKPLLIFRGRGLRVREKPPSADVAGRSDFAERPSRRTARGAHDCGSRAERQESPRHPLIPPLFPPPPPRRSLFTSIDRCLAGRRGKKRLFGRQGSGRMSPDAQAPRTTWEK